MPNLVIKMMMSYLITAEQTTLSVRERIGNYTPLLVSYSAERYEVATTWMQWQIERVNTVFHLHIESQALSERFHEKLLERLNTF